MYSKIQHMYAWLVCLPTRGKTAPSGVFKFSGIFKAPVNYGASFLHGAGSPPWHRTPTGAMLPGSPTLKKSLKSARLLLPDVPAPTRITGGRPSSTGAH
jgi:hypothetical protein